MWLLLLACTSDPEKEVEINEISGQQEKEVLQHPILDVSSPRRAQFIVEDDVLVQGTVQEGTNPLSSWLRQ